VGGRNTTLQDPFERITHGLQIILTGSLRRCYKCSSILNR